MFCVKIVVPFFFFFSVNLERQNKLKSLLKLLIKIVVPRKLSRDALRF